MLKITDIWFDTSLGLEELARRLALGNIAYDYENVFEWVTGTLVDQEINISRAQNKPTVGIFLSYEKPPKKQYPEKLCEALVAKLQAAGISPIYLGELTLGGGNEKTILSLAREIK